MHRLLKAHTQEKKRPTTVFLKVKQELNILDVTAVVHSESLQQFHIFKRQETHFLPSETTVEAFGFLFSLTSTNSEHLKCVSSRLCFIYVRDFKW